MSKVDIKNPCIWAILFCLAWWAYLFFTTQMEIRHDAIGYENLGKMIYKEGWLTFFKTGPQREPLYPYIISLSMQIADTVSVHYQYIQKLFQALILLISQILLYLILNKLRIHPIVKAITLLYFGISPAIVNSAFSLFSEILAYPVTLAIILTTVHLWQNLKENKNLSFAGLSITLGLLFCLAVSIKGVYEYIVPVYVFPFVLWGMFNLFRKNYKLAVRSLLAVIFILITFHSYAILYKSLNRKYNGHYAFTDRGPFMFYGSAVKRTQAMSKRKVLSGIAYIAGDGVCHSLFGKEECLFWTNQASDGFGMDILREMESQHYAPDKMQSRFTNESKRKIFTNPLQYLALTAMESLKMVFWESTRIGFVTYPPWLEKIYNFTLFKNILRLLITLWTAVSVLYVLIYSLKHIRNIFNPQPSADKDIILSFTALYMMVFTALYSLFTILTRYSFPIVPMFIIAMAVTTDDIMKKWVLKNQTSG